MKPISQSGLGVKMSWTPTVSGTVSSSAFSIPLEISTGVTLLSFWDLYLGAGGNLNFGSASLNGSGAGPVTVTGAADSTATLTIDPVSGKPGLVGLHGFLGTQFALWKARLFVQGTLGASSAYGVATGLRFVF
jgi:hypothetical protein